VGDRALALVAAGARQPEADVPLDREGKTPSSWNTKMRRGSGRRTGSPCASTSPRVGARKPASTFKSVDLPQPDGPTMHTNSPVVTSKSIPSSTRVGSLPDCDG